MLWRILPAFLLLLALCTTFADARPTRGTLVSRSLTVEERSLSNFERLKRGLPPRAPKLDRILPGRELFRPTRTQKGRRASPSPSPSPGIKVFGGRIAVRANEKSPVIGFVNNTNTGLLTVNKGGKTGTDLEVKMTITSTSSGPFSLMATNPSWDGPVFVGGGSNAALGVHSTSVVPLAGVPQTRPHSAPSLTGASAIWTIDTHTLQLIPVWTNPNAGKAKNLVVGYHTGDDTLFFSGDLDAFNEANGNVAIPVEFFLTK